MFKGHWLVADVDGTLLPTPNKAGGKYLSFTASAEAFAKSAQQQQQQQRNHYHSCLPALRTFLSRGGSLCAVSTAGRRLWQQVYMDLAPTLYPSRDETASSGPGQLLLCGFTGAAMFRTLPPSQLPEDWRRALAEEKGDTPTAAPPPSVALEEEVAYRINGKTTLSDDAQRAAAEEGRAAIIRFFEHASTVSGHDLAKARAFFAGCLSTKYHDVYTDILARMLEEVQAARLSAGTDGEPVCFAHTEPMRMEHLTTHGHFLKETNDALVDRQCVPLADGTVPRDAPVAQVVVMGIPMRYFDLVFSGIDAAGSPLRCCPACRTRTAAGEEAASVAGGGIARLRRLGLAVKKQPNSVCVHRETIDKGTCIRWLIHEGASIGFALNRALSFGDVPASVDRPLAEFPPMRMISLSPLRNDGCETAEDLQGLVDKGLLHVGGEEQGMALFLNHLLEDCERAGASGIDSGAGTAATQDGTAGGGADGDTWFTEARVRACAAKAACEVLHHL